MALGYFFVSICTVNHLPKSWFPTTQIISTDSIIAAQFAWSVTGLRRRKLTGSMCPSWTMIILQMWFRTRAQTISSMTLILHSKHAYYFWNQFMIFLWRFGEKWSWLVSKRQKLLELKAWILMLFWDVWLLQVHYNIISK